MLSRLRNLSRILGEAFDKDDALLLIGLLLVIGGLWAWSRALALIVPGGVLVWVFLPSRPPFVDPPTPRSRRSTS